MAYFTSKESSPHAAAEGMKSNIQIKLKILSIASISVSLHSFKCGLYFRNWHNNFRKRKGAGKLELEVFIDALGGSGIEEH